MSKQLWQAGGLVIALAAVFLTGCASDDELAGVRSENLTLKDQVKQEHQNFETTQAKLQAQYDHASSVSGNLELRLMANSQAADVMISHMVALHLQLITYRKSGDVAADAEPLAAYQKLKSPWFDDQNRRLYYAHMHFVQPVEIPLNDQNGLEKLMTEELWFLPDAKTHQPVFYLQNGAGRFDVYAYDGMIGNQTYKWDTWVKDVLEFDNQFASKKS